MNKFDPYKGFIMQGNDLKENIKKTLWDFLCAQEKARISQTNEDIIFRDLTLCPCIESIQRYYLSQGIDITTEARQPNANLNIRVLDAVKKVRDRFFVHNVFSPFQTQNGEEIDDILILRKNNDLNIDLVQKTLFKTACEIFGFKNQMELIDDLHKQHFPILTDSPFYKSTADYIIETNKLYEYLENDLGFTRKETPYVFGYLMGTFPTEKRNRNRFLHEKIDANPSCGMLEFDPEVPQLYRKMIDMCISVEGKGVVIQGIRGWIHQQKKFGTKLNSKPQKITTTKELQKQQKSRVGR